MIISGVISVLSVVIPKEADIVTWLPDYSWFLGCALGFATYYFFATRQNVAGITDPTAPDKSKVAA